MKHLYIIRHGQSEYNRDGLLAGTTDTPLTDVGREQAHEAGAQLRDKSIDYILCSPLSRAHETATIIAGEIGYDPTLIEVNELARERNFGELEGSHWYERPLTGTPGIETKEALLERVQKLYDYVKTRPEDTILIVAHGSFIRAFRNVIDPNQPYIDALIPTVNAKLEQLV